MTNTSPNPRSSVTVRDIHAGRLQIGDIHGDVYDSSDLHMSVDDHATVLRRKIAAEARVRSDAEKINFKRWLFFPGIPLVLAAIALLVYPQIIPTAINAIVHELMAPLTSHHAK